jgi:hypothetical protein
MANSMEASYFSWNTPKKLALKIQELLGWSMAQAVEYLPKFKAQYCRK